MTTHSPECYKWHHDCAVAEVERLRAALAQQAEPLRIDKVDAIYAESSTTPLEFARAIERAHGIRTEARATLSAPCGSLGEEA